MISRLRNEYLISYDIEDNKIRTGIFKELGKYGLKDVQKSVFWGCLTKAELRSLQRFLYECLDDHDKVFIIRTHFSKRGYSFSLGHDKEDFKDWSESHVI